MARGRNRQKKAQSKSRIIQKELSAENSCNVEQLFQEKCVIEDFIKPLSTNSECNRRVWKCVKDMNLKDPGFFHYVPIQVLHVYWCTDLLFCTKHFKFLVLVAETTIKKTHPLPHDYDQIRLTKRSQRAIYDYKQIDLLPMQKTEGMKYTKVRDVLPDEIFQNRPTPYNTQ